MHRIVIIEDEAPILDLIGEALGMEGYDVIAISHPDEVERAIAGVNPDLFLTDIMLQGKSGIEIAQELRDAGFRHTPMIAMSASKTMVHVAMSSGVFQGAIEKPFDLDMLLGMVEQMIEPAQQQMMGQPL